MRVLGNILWFILGGFVAALLWFVVGLLQCITIVGIPGGLQAFKMAGLALAPFGKEVLYSQRVGKAFLNIIWILLGGLELAIFHFAVGLVCFVTIIGIPFGIQYFKMGKLALMPFGAVIVPKA